MIELTVYLDDTNKEQFCAWLNSYTEKMGRVSSPEYPYMDGAVYRIMYYDIFQVNKVSFSARIKQRPSNGEPPPGILVINVFDPEENLTYSCWEWDMDNALSLSWLEVGKRLKVTIKHEGAKWIIPPVFQLLWAIKADFPSTSDSITRYIVEKADWWNLNPPYSLEDKAAMAYIIAGQAREEINRKANQPTGQDVAQVGSVNLPKDSQQYYIADPQKGTVDAWGKVKEGYTVALIPDSSKIKNSVNEITEVKGFTDLQMDQGGTLNTVHETMYLVCDKREFRDWIEHQYPAHAEYYKDTPEGAMFRITLTNFNLVYTSENGRYKYVFAVTEPNGHPKIREDFIGTVRNTFEIPEQAVGTAKPEKLPRKKLLDKACIEWASRDSHGYLGRYTREEFLEDFQEKMGEVITKDEFRRALEDAQKRGIIENINGRLKPKTRP